MNTYHSIQQCEVDMIDDHQLIYYCTVSLVADIISIIT